MQKVFYILILLLLTIISRNSFSQKPDIRFNHITSEQGLTCNNIRAITQDSSGFLWVASNIGIFRFDGYVFKNITSDKSNKYSLISNDVRCLFVDSKGRLWIGTNDGLSIYNEEKERFINFIAKDEDPNDLSNKLVGSVFEDSNHDIWLGCWDGINRLVNPNEEDINKFQFEYFPYYKDKEPPFIPFIESISEDRDGFLWFGNSRGGVHKFDKENKEYTEHYYNKDDETDLMSDDNVNDILIDNDNDLWVSTWEGGLYLFNRKTKTFKNYVPDEANPYSILSHQVREMLQDSKGNIWIGTEEGLCLFDKYKECFYNYKYDIDNETSLSSRVVLDIFEDNSGIIWIADGKGGLNYIDPVSTNIELYKVYSQKDSKNSVARSLHLAPDGNVFVGTFQSLDIFNVNTKSFSQYIFPPNNKFTEEIFHNGAKVSIIDGHNRIWFANTNSNIYDLKTKEFISIKSIYPNKIYPERSFNYIYEDNNGGIWLRDFVTLAHYNENNGQYIYFFFSDSIKKQYPFSYLSYNDIIQDKNENIWFTFIGGIGKIPLSKIQTKDSIVDYFIPFDNQINDINIDDFGNVWLATNMGLMLVNDSEKTLQPYTTDNGLCSNNVYDIIRKKSGGFCLVTNNGISLFNVKTKQFSNFYKENGFITNSFKPASSCVDRSGRIYLGSESGFNVFHPDSMNLNIYEAPVLITNFKVFNKELKIADDSPLKKSVFKMKEIELDYWQNQIMIEFTSLDFSFSKRIKYQYMLEGSHEHWINTVSREVMFTGLNPGEYNFKVRASTQAGRWNSNVASLRIIIQPPFWLTWWFKSIIILIILISIYSFYKVRVNSLKRRQEELEKQVRERTVEILTQKEEIQVQADNLLEINAMLQEKQEKIKVQADEIFNANTELQKLNATKDKFFSIIAHDLKNPFHAISGFADVIVKQFDIIVKDKLLEIGKMIQSSSKSASGLLENLLEWARTQTGNITFTAEVFDVYDLSKSITDLLTVNANAKNIKLKNNFAENTLIYADKNMISTVLRNIINNAIKFTPEGGSVTLKSEKKKDSILLKVIDTGVGMDKKNIDNLFGIDKSYSTKGTSGESGTGLGLIICMDFVKANQGTLNVESKPGKGSVFVVELPVKKGVVLELPKENIEEKESDKPLTETIEPVKSKDKLRVLVVEDTLEIRANLIASLESYYDIIEAVNGLEGLNYAIKTLPDLIISDVMMPQMDGFELCEKLKKNENTSHIPIILLTAKSLKSDKLTGLGIGADDYITKPFDADLLIARSENLIKSRILLREKYQSTLNAIPSEVTVSTIDEQFLQKAMNYVESNLEDNSMSGADIMKEVGMGKSTFFKKLKAITGQTPSEFIRGIRLKKAAQLILHDKNLPVTEVGYMVGFNDRTYFYKCFLKEFDCPPSEFGKKNQV